MTTWLFPEWFVGQEPRRDPHGVRSRPLVHRLDLDRGMRFRLEARDKPQRVVPVRFVQACTRGHVSDIDWRVFVHGKGVTCTRRLWLDERGTTYTIAMVFSVAVSASCRVEWQRKTSYVFMPFGD